MVFASFLLTEVAAYPAFLWALLGLQHATVARARARRRARARAGSRSRRSRGRSSPCSCSCSRSRSSRTSSRSRRAGPRRLDRVRSAARSALSGHRVLAVVYARRSRSPRSCSPRPAGFSDTLGTYAAGGRGQHLPAPLRALPRRARGDDRARARDPPVPRRRRLARRQPRRRVDAGAAGVRGARLGDDRRARARGDLVRPPLRRRRRPRAVPLLRRPGRARRARRRVHRPPLAALVAARPGRGRRVRLLPGRAADVREAERRHARLGARRQDPRASRTRSAARRPR